MRYSDISDSRGSLHASYNQDTAERSAFAERVADGVYLHDWGGALYGRGRDERAARGMKTTVAEIAAGRGA